MSDFEINWMKVRKDKLPTGKPVMTKVKNGKEIRCLKPLTWDGNLWRKTLTQEPVFYTPTHFAIIE